MISKNQNDILLFNKTVGPEVLKDSCVCEILKSNLCLEDDTIANIGCY